MTYQSIGINKTFPLAIVQELETVKTEVLITPSSLLLCVCIDSVLMLSNIVGRDEIPINTQIDVTQ